MRIIFPSCGAESHPAFWGAHQRADGLYVLEHPKASWISTAKKVKRQWAADKLQHLASWGCHTAWSEE